MANKTMKTVTVQVKATFYGDIIDTPVVADYLQRHVETGCEDMYDLMSIEFGTVDVTETAGHPDDETWLITPETVADVDNQLDREYRDVFVKTYWQYVDGRNQVVGLRVGQDLGKVVALFGDTLVRSVDGEWSVRKGA